MRRTKRSLLAAPFVVAVVFNVLMLFLAVVVVAGPFPQQSAGQAGTAERILGYDVAIVVHPDATMDVEETIRVRAAGNLIRHGILRDFPTQYKDGAGGLHVVGFRVSQILLDGQPQPYTVVPWANGERIRIGRGNVELQPGEYTYVIKYQTDRQLGFFSDHDELYWNATGFWSFDIDQATVRVRLPAGVPADKLRLDAYTGAQGTKGKVFTLRVLDGIPTFATTAPLGPQQGLTIVVGWPKGFVTQPAPRGSVPAAVPARILRPAWKLRTIRDAGGNFLAASALVVVLVLGFAWMLVGRDPPQRSVAVLYEPPDNLSPAAMRYVRKLRADPKGLSAAVLNLATKKILTIAKDGRTYVLTRGGSEPQPALSREEKQIAELLFSGSDTSRAQPEVQMGELKATHPTLASVISKVIAMAGTPDDASHTHLRPASTRVLKAYEAIRKILRETLPTNSLMKRNRSPLALVVLGAVGATVASVARYPGRLAANNWNLVPLAVFVMVIQLIFDLRVASHLSTLLPASSFAPTQRLRSKILNFAGLVGTAVFAIASGWALASITSLEWAIAFSAIWLTIGMFSRFLQQATALGQRYWNEIEGFRQFLAEVDEDRLNVMNPPNKTPALFERMLPYALALDCEVQWAKKFAGVLAMAATTQGGNGASYSPSWYSGPPGSVMDPAAFTSSFATSFGEAIASSATTPGSSSGFSDGGSSGGGGGGGGGSGW